MLEKIPKTNYKYYADWLCLKGRKYCRTPYLQLIAGRPE